MDADALKELVIAQTVISDGKRKLGCAKALELAKAHQVSPAEIGRICDENGVKIVHCQLGCFK